jgi:hypothetical protein
MLANNLSEHMRQIPLASRMKTLARLMHPMAQRQA